MRKEINVSYIKICKMLQLNEYEGEHIVNCPLECNEICSNRIMIQRSHNKAKCLGADKEIKIGELDMILVSEFDEDNREIKELMKPPF
ncbi:hypothetical protein [Orenia marismortui]|uniref:Uncharacterized protein n=1 Tax=Orenia marismortui TaxID=46469 RepID=A0A4R8GTW5_9FIRM|nr:hypothetical protein [Orenia marismortui]TDX48294.1 hypothetical protein C7959_13021 [Orenia marismortui]